MSYLSKLSFAALIAFSLLFAGDDNKNIGEIIGDDTKIVPVYQNARLSTDADIDLIEPISCCDFLIPDIENVFDKYGRLLRCDLKNRGMGSIYAFLEFDKYEDAEVNKN